MMRSNTLFDDNSSRQFDLSFFRSSTDLPEGHENDITSLLSLTGSNALFNSLLAGFFFFRDFYCDIEFLYTSNVIS